MNNLTKEMPFRFVQETVTEIFDSFNLIKLDNFDFLEGEVKFRGKYLVSMVGFVGDYTGLLSIYCSCPMAMHITERMLNIQVDTVTKEVRDALGELTNIIVGRFKAKLSVYHTPFQQSIPSVIDGDNFSANGYDLVQNRLLACGSAEGTIYVQLLLKS